MSFFSRFRKKKTTIETLEELDKNIKDYDKYRQKNELNQRKYIGALVIYSILFYIIGALVYYIYLMPTNLVDRFKTLIPFFISPLLIYGLRRFLKWFFLKRTNYIEKRLNDFKEEKKSILEDVKEKETYKKAKEILERFSNGDIQITPPTSPAQNNASMTMLNTPFISKTPFQQQYLQNMQNTNLVHRNVRSVVQEQPAGSIQSQQQLNVVKSANVNMNNTMNASQFHNSIQTQSKQTHLAPNQTQNLSLSSSSISTSTSNNINNNNNNNNNSNNLQSPVSFLAPQVPPPSNLALSSQARTLLPRPIVAPNRTFFDKLLDFVIGEGPNNRYALICKSCHFHNGMALKEEFEYVAFRCAYCLFFNEARKTKLTLPKLNNNNTNDSNASNKIKNLNDSTGGGDSTNISTSSESIDEINNLSEPISSSSTVPAAASVLPNNGDLARSRSTTNASNINRVKDEVTRKRMGSLSNDVLTTAKISNGNNNINKLSSHSIEKLNVNYIDDSETNKENTVIRKTNSTKNGNLDNNYEGAEEIMDNN